MTRVTRVEQVERLTQLAADLHAATGRTFPIVLWTGDVPVLQVGDHEVAVADGTLDVWTSSGTLAETDVPHSRIVKLAEEATNPKGA